MKFAKLLKTPILKNICEGLLLCFIVGIPPGFRGEGGGDWRFLKILSKGGGIETDSNFRGGNGLFRGDKFFQGGLRAYHVNFFLF